MYVFLKDFEVFNPAENCYLVDNREKVWQNFTITIFKNVGNYN